MSILDPFTHALATVVATAHDALSALGADPASGATWVAATALLVVAVRLALLPLAVHGVRQAHAAARARPSLKAIAERHRRASSRVRRDPEALRALAEERRKVSAEHGVSPLGCLSVLVQLPVWLALYQLVTGAASGVSVGAMDAALVASLAAATVVGVPLAERGLTGGSTHLVLVVSLALVAAGVGYLTQRFLVAPNSSVEDLPEQLARFSQLAPALSALGVLLAAGFVPVAVLVYWVANGTWSCAQAAVVHRWFPSPGTPAAAARAARLAGRRAG